MREPIGDNFSRRNWGLLRETDTFLVTFPLFVARRIWNLVDSKIERATVSVTEISEISEILAFSFALTLSFHCTENARLFRLSARLLRAIVQTQPNHNSITSTAGQSLTVRNPTLSRQVPDWTCSVVLRESCGMGVLKLKMKTRKQSAPSRAVTNAWNVGQRSTCPWIADVFPPPPVAKRRNTDSKITHFRIYSVFNKLSCKLHKSKLRCKLRKRPTPNTKSGGKCRTFPEKLAKSLTKRKCAHSQLPLMTFS